VTSKLSERLTGLDTLSLLSLQKDPSPMQPEYSSFKYGTDIAPKIGLFLYTRPIEVPKKGYPWE